MKKAIFYLLILQFTNVLSLYYGWYLKWEWFDIVQHFLGGFLVAMLMVNYLKSHFLPGEKIKNTLIAVGATIFIGVVWEFSEYLANQTLVEPMYKYFGIVGYFMGDLEDTIIDLLMDILGALTFVLIFKTTKKSGLNFIKGINSEQV